MHRSKLDQPLGNAPGRAPAAQTRAKETQLFSFRNYKNINSHVLTAKIVHRGLFDKCITPKLVSPIFLFLPPLGITKSTCFNQAIQLTPIKKHRTSSVCSWQPRIRRYRYRKCGAFIHHPAPTTSLSISLITEKTTELYICTVSDLAAPVLPGQSGHKPDVS